jgi:hypothetical protein
MHQTTITMTMTTTTITMITTTITMTMTTTTINMITTTINMITINMITTHLWSHFHCAIIAAALGTTGTPTEKPSKNR